MLVMIKWRMVNMMMNTIPAVKDGEYMMIMNKMPAAQDGEYDDEYS